MSASAIFSGSSRYANDFAQIIERSVAIASLPLTQLGSQRGKLVDESSALASLQSKFAALRSAVENIEEAGGQSSYAVSTSDGSVVAAALSGTALAGTYTVDVVSTGARASATSKESLSDVTDPASSSLSTAGSFQLTIGGTSYTITPAANTLNALAAAINGTTAAGVQAVIVNLGTAASPDYRLSIQNNKLGPATIQLSDGSQDLMAAATTGAAATYRLNGEPAGAPISSDAAVGVEIAPGLTVSLLKAGTSTVTVERSEAALGSALSSFVAAYNGLISELDLHRGEAGGALSGRAIVSELSHAARRLVGFSSPGSVGSVTDLGFSFDDKGVLTFDTSALSRVGERSFEELQEFLGSATAGGFLQNADLVLDSFDTAVSGALPVAIESTRSQISAADESILANQVRVDLLRESLASQMAAADALIAAMEQQVRYMSGLVDAVRINVESFR
jgi:flagellar hook-associated protein 2